jgi:hypothetical protein
MYNNPGASVNLLREMNGSWLFFHFLTLFSAVYFYTAPERYNLGKV